MVKMHIRSDKTCGGFYKEELHDSIPNPNISMIDELWEYLLRLGEFKFVGNIENRIYTISDKPLFEEIVRVEEGNNNEPSLYDRMRVLEEENANLTFLLMMNGVI